MTCLVLAIVMSLISTTSAPHGDELDREGLLALLHSKFDDLRDIEFRYEGEFKRLKPVDDSGRPPNLRFTPENRAKFNSKVSYQGTFAYRSDRSAHQDIFYRYDLDKEPTREEIKCLLGTDLSRRLVIADQGGPVGPDKKSTAHIGAVVDSYSPLWFVGFPLLQAYAGEPSIDYQCLGWESVDGQKCLKLELSLLNPNTKRPGWAIRYWIDVERGANPIRIEELQDGQLIVRTSEIKLGRFEANDGKAIWVPASGRLQGFNSGWGPPSTTPLYEQNFMVIQGYPRLNQGLPDARFTLDWGKEPGSAAKVAAVRKKPVSAQERLVAALDQADKQAGGVEAGSPAREGWLARRWGSLALGLAGVVVFATVAVIKRRAG